jgi:hypothetical protein
VITLQSLSDEDKISFFIKCQNLLSIYHPNSTFAFRKNNIKERLEYAETILTKYKGLVYSDDNLAVLYNLININEQDINNPVKILNDNVYREPKSDYNAVTIDFVVMKNLKSCLNFIKHSYVSEIKYLIYVKDGKPKVYVLKDMLTKGLNIPMV